MLIPFNPSNNSEIGSFITFILLQIRKPRLRELQKLTGPGWVAQLVRVLSPYTIPGQGTYKNQPMNA